MLIPFLIFTALPPPSRDSSHKSVFERLSTVAAEERSAKFLLTEELLHQFELLHPSRSTQIHEVPTEVPDSPVKTPDLPISTKEHMRGEISAETLLVKCSTPRDDTGPSEKPALAPIIEEEEEPLSQTRKSADKGADGGNQVGHDGDDVFGDLSDIIITSQELFKEDPAHGKAIPPTIEATSALQQSLTPLSQELPLTVEPITYPQLRSGSLVQRE